MRVFRTDAVARGPCTHSSSLSHTAGVTRYNENFNDAVTQISALAAGCAEGVGGARSAFLNRWNGCGCRSPRRGQPEAFSPLTFLMFPLPWPTGLRALVLAKPLLAFCGMWLWLAEMGVLEDGGGRQRPLFVFSLGLTAWLLYPLASVLCPGRGRSCVRGHSRSLGGGPAGRFPLLAGVLVWWGLGHPEMTALGAPIADALGPPARGGNSARADGMS